MKRIFAFLVWLALAAPAVALPAVTQLGTANGTTTAIITTSATANAGSLIVVVANSSTSGIAVSSVVDSGLNCTTYTALDNAAVASRPTNAIFYCANSGGLASGGSITITVPSGDAIAATAFAVDGMAVSPADIHAKQVNGASGTSATSTSTGTTGQTYELTVGTLALSGTSSAFTPGGRFTSVGGLSSANGSAYAAYLFNCSTSSTSFAPTWTTSNAYMSNVVTFKSAAADAICSSKNNTYPVLQFGNAASLSSSKENAYDVLKTGTAASLSASKEVTYFVLKTAQPSKTFFHSFPP